MISVVIPTQNRPRQLSAALSSIAEQTYHDVEVVVVNDGGMSVHDVVCRWHGELRIELLNLERVMGASAARNAGVEQARGTWIAFLDDDDLFLPTHLEHAARALRSGAGFVYLGAMVSDSRADSVRELPPATHFKDYPYDPRLLLVANYIHTGSIVVENYSGTSARFDECLGVCEDWDMWLTLTRDHDYPVAFVDELTSIYHQIDGANGLVAQGQTAVPSPFSLTREEMHRRWPTDDSKVLRYREWFTAFEDFRNELIEHEFPIPHQLFDATLRHVHDRFSHDAEPDYDSIPRLFGASRFIGER